MYILFVTRGYPTPRYPFHGCFERDQAKAVAKRGHKVVVASVDLRSIRRRRQWGITNFKDGDVEIYSIDIPVGAAGSSILDRVGCRAILKLYRRIVREQGVPDVLHAHFLGSSVPAAALSEKESLPLVTTVHDSRMLLTDLNRREFDRAKKNYQKVTELIAVSQTLKEKLYNNFDVEAAVIPNIVDLDAFEFHENKQTANEDCRFVSVGSLIKRKGFDILLKAFSQLRGNHHLTIFGDGPERKNLELLAEKLSIDGCVEFMGAKLREEIARDFQNEDVFVLASRRETFGVSYIEAMASGLPIIATKCGGPDDFMTDEVGTMVPVDDVGALKNAMEHMVRNRGNYDPHGISQYVKERYSPAVVAGQLEEVYLEARG